MLSRLGGATVRLLRRIGMALGPAALALGLSAAAAFVLPISVQAQTVICTGGPVSAVQLTARYVKATNTCTLSTDNSSLSDAGDLVLVANGGPVPSLVNGRRGVGTGWSVTNFSVCNLGDGSGDLGAAQCQIVTPPEGTDLTATLEWDSSNPASPVAADRRMVAVYQRNGGTMTLKSASVTPFDVEINVKGNGQSIGSGDTTPDTADHTDFGSAAVTGGTVTRTFTIENTGTLGTLVFGSNAVSISGNSDFTVSAQPPTTLAPGAFALNTTTFQITFDPSSNGTKTATVSINNNDTDENPYTFAIQGTGTGGSGATGGTVTIVQKVTGADSSFGFTSSTGALNVTITTASGTGQASATGLAAGTHTVTAADMSAAGYSVIAISCDDTDSSGDVASRSAAIVLADGENVTCTFESADNAAVTSQMIADYLGARNAMILNHQPDPGRRLGRLRHDAPDDGTATLAMFGLAPSVPSPIDVRMSGQLLSYAASARTMREFFYGRSDQGIDIPDLGKWDIWSEGQFALFSDNTSQNGNFGIVHAGVDYLATPDMLIGLKLEVDWMNQYFTATSGTVSGVGWMAGPYGTIRLAEDFYLDLGASWGTSSNAISPFGTYADRFNTTRWMAHGALIGEFKVDMLTVTPRVAFQYISENQHAYTDGMGVSIPAQTISQGQVELAPRFAYEIDFGDGNVLSPWVETGLVYAFGQAGAYSTGSYAAGSLGLSGNLKAGFGWRMPGGAQLALSARYDGIGSANDSYGGRIALSVPLD